MATHHASAGEIVNLVTWANDLSAEHSKCIARTEDMELARLVMPPGETVGQHHFNGPLVVQCLSGVLEVTALGKVQTIGGGELLYLPPAEQFTLCSLRYSLVLVTFIFRPKA